MGVSWCLLPLRSCMSGADLRSGVLQVPMEYNHLQEIPVLALRNRLLLLQHISELFCPCIPMFDLEGALGEAGLGPSVGSDTLRGILISQGKVPSLWSFFGLGLLVLGPCLVVLRVIHLAGLRGPSGCQVGVNQPGLVECQAGVLPSGPSLWPC